MEKLAIASKLIALTSIAVVLLAQFKQGKLSVYLYGDWSGSRVGR